MRTFSVKLVLLLVLLLILCSCSSSSDRIDSSDGDIDDDSIDGSLDTDYELMDGNEPVETDNFEQGEKGNFKIEKFSIIQNPRNHLSAIVKIETEVETTARILIKSEDGEEWKTPVTENLSKKYELAIFGMVSSSKYEFEVKCFDTDGNWVEEEYDETWQTDPLPDDFPPITINISKPEKMQKGITIFNVYRWTPATDLNWGLLLAIDEKGRVIWYHRLKNLSFDLDRMKNGNLFYTFLEHGVTEVDMLGEDQNTWYSLTMGHDTIHHEVNELANGNMLTLSTEIKTFDDYTDEKGQKVSYNVVSDIIVEFDTNEKIIQQIPIIDFIDHKRIKEGFHSNFWNLTYFSVDNPKDLTHANSIAYDDRDNTYIISVRNQDWIMKIDPETKKLIWKLGEDGDFKLVDGEWMYHQHACKLLENHNLLMYDNGNGRSTLKDNEAPFTRVVEFEVDEDKKEVRQVWEYRGENPYYASFVGDVSRLDNGNTLIVDGGLNAADPLLPDTDPSGGRSVRIVEVTTEKNPEKVFELTIEDDTGKTGYTSYRAIRVPSLYP